MSYFNRQIKRTTKFPTLFITKTRKFVRQGLRSRCTICCFSSLRPDISSYYKTNKIFFLRVLFFFLTNTFSMIFKHDIIYLWNKYCNGNYNRCVCFFLYIKRFSFDSKHSSVVFCFTSLKLLISIYFLSLCLLNNWNFLIKC